MWCFKHIYESDRIKSGRLLVNWTAERVQAKDNFSLRLAVFILAVWPLKPLTFKTWLCSIWTFSMLKDFKKNLQGYSSFSPQKICALSLKKKSNRAVRVVLCAIAFILHKVDNHNVCFQVPVFIFNEKYVDVVGRGVFPICNQNVIQRSKTPQCTEYHPLRWAPFSSSIRRHLYRPGRQF